jgi:hypothetical protein
MSKEEAEAKAAIDASVPCIRIEIRLAPTGPILCAYLISAMMNDDLSNAVKDIINAAADAALRAALEVLTASVTCTGIDAALDERGITTDDDFFDRVRTIDDN